MSLWNKAHLNPPHNFCEYSINEEIEDSLSNFVRTLTKAADIGGPNHPLWAEVEVFQTLKLRFATKTPCDKFVHMFQRVGKCIQKLVTLDLSKLYLELAEMFLSGLQSSSSKVMLPSRCHLEYVLIRTQSSSKLLCEALSYSREAFCYLLQRLALGHMLQNFLMACSVIARISIYFKCLLTEVCDAYKEIKPWCAKLPSGTWKWDGELDLPDDLWIWLKFEESFLKEDHLPAKTEIFLNKVFKNTSQSASENINMDIQNFLDNSLINGNEKKERNESNMEAEENRIKIENISDEDTGEIISRETKRMSNTIEVKLKKENNDSNPQMPSLNEAKLEKSLLQLKNKIFTTKTFKRLRTIWVDIVKERNGIIKRRHLSPRSVKTIRRLFNEQKQIRQIGKQSLSDYQMKNVTVKDVSHIAETFVSNLVLNMNKPTIKEKKVINTNSGILELKRTKTLKGIKKLLEVILHIASVRKKFCQNLRHFVMSEMEDIRLLKQNGELKLARCLAIQTSNAMIRRYQNMNL